MVANSLKYINTNRQNKKLDFKSYKAVLNINKLCLSSILQNQLFSSYD